MAFGNVQTPKRSSEEVEQAKKERMARMFGNNIPASNSESATTSTSGTLINSVTGEKADITEQKIYNISLDLIDENPENEKIFSMENIEDLAQAIKEDGFHGAIEVRLKDNERFEILSGHRRYRAMQLLGNKSIPAIIIDSKDDLKIATLLLRSNINNRDMTPLDYARAIQFYIDNIQPHVKYEGRSRDNIAQYFHMSSSMIHRYMAITKVIPELQVMANSKEFPFSAFASAATLSEEQQKELYQKINEFMQANEGVSIKRDTIESMIRRIKSKTMDEEHIKKNIYLEDYIYKAKVQLEKIKVSDKIINDKEMTNIYLNELEDMIKEIREKLK